ncbi:MAG: hypothetical protein LBV31_03290 [Prevotellaceae bacterium]|jgi:hypothetical protein|nr:hypothetical protein [Prevotellaceae bacterium]
MEQTATINTHTKVRSGFLNRNTAAIVDKIPEGYESLEEFSANVKQRLRNFYKEHGRY